MTLGAEGAGLGTCYLPFFLLFSLCFIKRRYDKKEFDCYYDFLKSSNKILSAVILKKRKVFAFVRNGLSNIYYRKSVCFDSNWFSQINFFVIISIHS